MGQRKRCITGKEGSFLSMQTIRQAIIEMLSQGEYKAIDISQTLKLREKEVFDHLQHIKRTLSSHGKRLIIIPARCLECSFVFESRNRFTKPGRCPRCRGEHIEDPKYSIV
jgi:transcriptional regulator